MGISNFVDKMIDDSEFRFKIIGHTMIIVASMGILLALAGIGYGIKHLPTKHKEEIHKLLQNK